MKTGIIISLALFAALVAFSIPAQQHSVSVSTEKLSAADYETIAADIAENINDLSPTPPTSRAGWHVTEVQFASDSKLVYAVYNDTHNMFRILLTVEKRGADYRYDLAAAFEPAESAGKPSWKLAGGEDLAKGKETAIIITNNQ